MSRSGNPLRETRIVLVIGGLVSIVLLLLRIFVIPLAKSQSPLSAIDVFAELSDLLIAALLGSLVATLIILWKGPSSQIALITHEVLQPGEIGPTLRAAYREEVSEWFYRGHAAEYFSSVTLPELARNEHVSTKTIRILILDPASEVAHNAYEEYRNRGPSHGREADPWGRERVALRVYATILRVLILREESRFDVDIRLGEIVSPLRLDICSSMVLLTQEDSTQPAICYRRLTSPFYWAYREDFRMTMEQSRRLFLPRRGLDLALDVNNVRRVLYELDPTARSLNDSDIDTIISMASANRDKYRR